MTTIVSTALVLSLILYIGIGLFYRRKIVALGDIIPIIKGTTAKVSNSVEFSSTTVATTISLATVIVAFFELVPGLGLWLFWPVATTSLGLWLFSLIANRIWKKMEGYGHRPSMHEFLGVEFSSKRVAFVGAVFTTLGYLAAFAVELTVGSRFLAGLIPGIPEWVTVCVITAVGFLYTGLGGFRSVVVSDRVQMVFIWLLLVALIAFYAQIGVADGFSQSIQRIPENVRTLTWSNGLIPFVAGILIMNLFTYVSNMGLWQRIAGSQEPHTVVKGMRKSVYQSLLSWGLFVIVAIGAFMVVAPAEGENLLVTLLKSLTSSPFGQIVTFCVVLGLYGAMLSTASTQLIAVSHTIYEDILAPLRGKTLEERITSKKELTLSRIILVVSAIGAVGVVEILRYGGFTIADLAFAVYGAALGLVPPILVALFVTKRDALKKLSIWANVAVTLGFTSGWGIAIVGKIVEDGNMVFLAPCVSIGVSGCILALGYIMRPKMR